MPKTEAEKKKADKVAKEAAEKKKKADKAAKEAAEKKKKKAADSKK